MPDAPPADGDESVPLLWRWLPLRLALAALPLAPIFTVLAFNVGPFIKIDRGGDPRRDAGVASLRAPADRGDRAVR